MSTTGSLTHPNWDPFIVLPLDSPDRGPPPRSINSKEGVADRMRAAAFAEIQARDAFYWGAKKFAHEAPLGLIESWIEFAEVEHKHLGWLLKRMEELGFDVKERPVHAHLWVSLVGCTDARSFAHYMANAEERGRKAGERFYHSLKDSDPVTAKVFSQIALEEVEHIQTSFRYYPLETTSP